MEPRPGFAQKRNQWRRDVRTVRFAIKECAKPTEQRNVVAVGADIFLRESDPSYQIGPGAGGEGWTAAWKVTVRERGYLRTLEVASVGIQKVPMYLTLLR